MLYFTADPRDTYRAGGSCGICCCGEATVTPNETNKMVINYAAWAAPIGGRGLSNETQWSIDKKSGSEPPEGPVNTNYSVSIPRNTEYLLGDVATGASSPESLPLTYSLLPLSGPDNGVIDFLPNGKWSYTPRNSFVGYDNFFFVTSDGGQQIIREVIIQIQQGSPTPDLPAQAYTPPLKIDRNNIRYDAANYQISLMIEASPALRIGDVYRLTLRQATLDCDCNKYFHQSCYDFVVSKC